MKMFFPAVEHRVGIGPEHLTLNAFFSSHTPRMEKIYPINKRADVANTKSEFHRSIGKILLLHHNSYHQKHHDYKHGVHYRKCQQHAM